jgi:hypothetical protein
MIRYALVLQLFDRPANGYDTRQDGLIVYGREKGKGRPEESIVRSGDSENCESR